MNISSDTEDIKQVSKAKFNNKNRKKKEKSYLGEKKIKKQKYTREKSNKWS